MEFSFTETQEAIRESAAAVFAGHATPDRIRELETHATAADRMDRALWSALADAHLLGLDIGESDGGSGLGMTEVCLLLEQQGRCVAPIPLHGTALGAWAVATFGTDRQRDRWLPAVTGGRAVLAPALAEPGGNDATRPSTRAEGDGSGGWRLSGERPAVPWADVADAVITAATIGDDGIGIFVFDPRERGVERAGNVTTNREIHPHLHLDAAPAELVGASAVDAAGLEAWVRRAQVGLCAIQVGVAEEALRRAAAYTSGRVQFGRPLSTFQGVALKAADAYIDTEAMRATLWQAAWLLDRGDDAVEAVHVAKWWAADAGQRVVHATQHLHGGLGADVDYPIHRYFLWGKQIEVMLGGASTQLARLGQAIAARPELA